VGLVRYAAPDRVLWRHWDRAGRVGHNFRCLTNINQAV
jgi:hypothetical protein